MITNYCTVAEAISILESIGIADFSADEAVLAQNLFRASLWIDAKYGQLYPGILLAYDQPLLWPRTACVDSSGRIIASGTVPGTIKTACAMLANAFLNEVDVTEVQAIKLERTKVGPLMEETEYFQSAAQVKKPQVILDIELMLTPLIGNASGARVIFAGGNSNVSTPRIGMV